MSDGSTPESAQPSLPLQSEQLYMTVEEFLANLEERVAHLAVAGASRAEADEMDRVKESMHLLGEMVVRSVEIMDETEIPIRAEAPGMDEEAAYAVARDFIYGKRYGDIFSKRELREHLQGNGIEVEPKKFDRLFTNWRREIEDDARLSGANVVFTHVPRGQGIEAGSYSLAPIAARKTAARAPKAAPTDLHLQPEYAEQATERAAMAIRGIVGAHSNKRAALQVQTIAEALNVTAQDARSIMDTMVAQGSLYKDRREGTLFFSTTEPQKRVVAMPEFRAEEEVLNDKDERVARGILEALSRFKGTEYEQGMTSRELERIILLNDETIGLIGGRRINRIARLLESTGVIKSWQARKGQGGSQFRIGAADKIRHGLLKDRGNWDAIIASARAGQTFERPS